MTSLTEVYDGNARGVSLQRLYAGTGLVLCGAILAVLAVLVATTNHAADYVVAFTDWGMADHFAVVRVAGVLAGVGVPAALVGVFIVLPANRRVRAAAAISASLCLLGVALFWYAYPHNWRYGSDQLTLEVSAIYLLGLFTAVWCLFTAIVNFKTRNDPGGMLEMNVTRRNQTIVEIDESDGSSSGFGGIGFLGGTPEGDVETQTNAADAETNPNRDADDGTVLSFGDDAGSDRSTGGTASPNAGVATSDGGTATADFSSPVDATAGDGATPGAGARAEAGTGTGATARTGSPSSGRGTGAPTDSTAGTVNDAEIVDSSSGSASDDASDEHADRYCGNCRHFEYVRTESSGMVPYCARHDTAMSDMDACDEWVPNSR